MKQMDRLEGHTYYWASTGGAVWRHQPSVSEILIQWIQNKQYSANGKEYIQCMNVCKDGGHHTCRPWATGTELTHWPYTLRVNYCYVLPNISLVMVIPNTIPQFFSQQVYAIPAGRLKLWEKPENRKTGKITSLHKITFLKWLRKIDYKNCKKLEFFAVHNLIS